MKRIVVFISFLNFLIVFSATAADNFKDMFTQGSVRGDIRVLDFTRDFDSTQTRHDTAIGGLLYYKTDSLAGISFGVALGTSNEIGDNDNDAVYSLLGSDENGDHININRKQEYYIQGDWFNTTIKYGAQELNTPYLNTDDVRMLPRSYRGLSVVNKSFDGVKLSGYYITDSMGWNTDNYISMSQAVANEPGGASTISKDSPLLIAGIEYKLPTDSVKGDVQGWYYTMEDIFRISYLKATLSKDLGSINLYFMPSILYQKSQGDELNGHLSASQTGFRAGAKYAGFDLTGYYSKSGDDGMITPWGFDKIVNQQVMTSATRGHEDAWGAKLAYDFSELGLKGLSSYVFYALYDVDETATVKDTYETDFNIQYAFSGMLDGLGIRYRYADMNVHDGNSLTDTRILLTYKFAFSGK